MVTISGFSDEISDNFEEQLDLVERLGMTHISIRGINGKSFNDLCKEDVVGYVAPTLNRYGVRVSSIGSPLGKIFIDDQDGFAKQLVMLEKLCEFAKILDCKFIRVFSFYIPKSANPDGYKIDVIAKVNAFAKIAREHGITLLHENEKDIFGDTAMRCKEILDAVGSTHFRGIFDFANFVQVGQDPTHAYDLLHDYIDYIHIKDAKFDKDANVVCGTGDGNIEELLARFISKGYDGFLTLEPHLAMFGMLGGLELEDVEKVVDDLTLTGAQGYELQFNALTQILKKIEA